MANTYNVDVTNMLLTTNTIKLEGNELTTRQQPYEEIIGDLCKCMLEAIALDDADGKQAIGAALRMVLESVFESGDV